MNTLRTTSWKIGLLASLYFSQGLPYGFFTKAMPVWMRSNGMSLTLIGAANVLALPWALKLLWAPLVDRHRGSPLGPRRGWILPLQAASAVAIVGLAFLGTTASATATSIVAAMAIAMFVTNLFSATQDIATDGLAVDLLDAHERGLGNGVQVAAYRIGMVVGGGVLLSSFGKLGWLPTMLVMAGLIVLMSLPLLLYREPLHGSSSSSSSSSSQKVSWLSWLHYFTRNNGAAFIWAAALIAYKFGDALGSPMTQTLLVDRGYDVDDIGRIAGIYGSVAGMAGAMLGGVVARRSRLGALLVCGLVHAVLMLGYAWPAAVPNLDHTVTTVLFVVEHLTGGMATVALFTVMMDATRKSSGASDYTAQASIVVVASGVGSSLSGAVADAVGYEAHFVIAGVLCVLGTLAMVPVFRRGLVPRNDDDAVESA